MISAGNCLHQTWLYIVDVFRWTITRVNELNLTSSNLYIMIHVSLPTAATRISTADDSRVKVFQPAAQWQREGAASSNRISFHIQWLWQSSCVPLNCVDRATVFWILIFFCECTSMWSVRTFGYKFNHSEVSLSLNGSTGLQVHLQIFVPWKSVYSFTLASIINI